MHSLVIPVTDSLLVATGRGQNLGQFAPKSVDLASCGWPPDQVWSAIPPERRPGTPGAWDLIRAAEAAMHLRAGLSAWTMHASDCCDGEPSARSGWTLVGPEADAISAALDSMRTAMASIAVRLCRLMDESGITVSTSHDGETTYRTTVYVAGQPVACL